MMEKREDFDEQSGPLYAADNNAKGRVLSKMDGWEAEQPVTTSSNDIESKMVMAEPDVARKESAENDIYVLASDENAKNYSTPQEFVWGSNYFRHEPGESSAAPKLRPSNRSQEKLPSPIQEGEDNPMVSAGSSPTAPAEASGPKTVTSIGEGLGVAYERAKLAWEYLAAQAKQILTGEGADEAEAISHQYDNLPQTSGAATVADIGANVVGGVLPATLALAISPGAATVAGVGTIAADLATTIADANMAVDSFERKEGKEVSGLQRGAYVAAATATNVLMDVLVNSSVFKHIAPGGVEAISKDMFDKILRNPVAQAEFATMTKQVLRNEAKAHAKEAGKAAVSGGVSTGLLEAEKSLYTGEAPEMSKIVNSTMQGAAMGAVAGSLQAGAVAYDTHRRRQNTDHIAYASHTEGANSGRFPVSEMYDVKFENRLIPNSENSEVYIDGKILPSTGGRPEQRSVPDKNVVGGSYREAMNRGAGNIVKDNWKFTDKELTDYNQRWNESKEIGGRKGALMQNELLQEGAARMGISIKVYKSERELPPEIRNSSAIKDGACAFHAEDNSIGVILSNCENMSASQMLSILRHESVGHFGLPRLFETEQSYKEYLDHTGPYHMGIANEKRRKLQPGWQDIPYQRGDETMQGIVEESHALMAEDRGYWDMPTKDEIAREGYRRLQESEQNIRNTTVGEMRAKQISGGNPFPNIHEIEERRRRELMIQKMLKNKNGEP